MKKKNNRQSMHFKMAQRILVLALLCFGYVQGQDLVPYRVGDQWGFSDANRLLKIAVQYDSVLPFKFNKFIKKMYAKTIKNGEVSLIDVNGRQLSQLSNRKAKKVVLDDYLLAIQGADKTYELYNVIANKYYSEQISGYQFLKSVGLFVVRKNKKKGLLDESFNELIPIKYKKFKLKKVNMYSRKTSDKDLEILESLGVSYSKEDEAYYYENKEIGVYDSLVIITLISEEGSKKIVYRIPRKSVTRVSKERVIPEYVDHLDKERTKQPKFANFKFQNCYSRSKKCIYTTKMNGQLKYGVYDFALDKSSPLYDKIQEEKYNYTVSKNGKEGRMQRNFELSVPVEYEEVIPLDYVILKLKKVNNHGNNPSKYRYDYYNTIEKKFVLKDAQFFPEMNRYYELSKEPYGFFPVLKEDVYFYMGVDGRIFYKK